jgi:hypothetical protein
VTVPTAVPHVGTSFEITEVAPLAPGAGPLLHAMWGYGRRPST